MPASSRVRASRAEVRSATVTVPSTSSARAAGALGLAWRAAAYLPFVVSPITVAFGLLLLCRTPLLRDIGATVAIGVFAAMCFAFVLAGVKPGEEDAG